MEASEGRGGSSKRHSKTQAVEKEANGHKKTHKRQKRGAVSEGSATGEEPDSSTESSSKNRASKAKGAKRKGGKDDGQEEKPAAQQREGPRTKKSRTKDKVKKEVEEEEANDKENTEAKSEGDEKQEVGGSSSHESEEERGEGLESGQESKSIRYNISRLLPERSLTRSCRRVSHEDPPSGEAAAEEPKKGGNSPRQLCFAYRFD